MQNDLAVATTIRLAPPALLDSPLLTDRVNRLRVERTRTPSSVEADAAAARLQRLQRTQRPAHRGANP